MKQILLRNGGSKQHFWHFMLGYLLPSIHCITERLAGNIDNCQKDCEFLFQDCGPLMNPITKELLDLMGIPHRILPSLQAANAVDFPNNIWVPRWDVGLTYSNYFLFHLSKLVTDRRIPLAVKLSNVGRFNFKDYYFGVRLKKKLHATRNLILSKLSDRAAIPENDSYLLLDRSNQPEYYSDAGAAEKKGYGKSRRAFTNLQDGCQRLSADGISVSVYEPGGDSIIGQIRKFNASKGVIGLRGAEMANLLWLEPGKKVIVIDTMVGYPIHLYNFASMLGLQMTMLHASTQYPNFVDLNVGRYLK
jgi:hypothetical protein